MEWEWWDEPNMLKAFLFLLFEARYDDKKYKGFEVKRGQVWISVRQMGAKLGISHQEVRTVLKRLIWTNEIEIKATHQKSLITICNYEYYQDDSNVEQHTINTQNNKQTTQKQHKNNTRNNTEVTHKQHTEQHTKNTANNTQITQPKDCNTKSCDELVEKECEIFCGENSEFATHIIKKDNNISSSSLYKGENQKMISVENIYEWLKCSSQQWKETICMQLGLKSRTELDECFQFFQRELICHGIEEKNEKDIMKHFQAMMRIELSQRRKGNGNNQQQRKQSGVTDAEFANHIANQLADKTVGVGFGEKLPF